MAKFNIKGHVVLFDDKDWHIFQDHIWTPVNRGGRVYFVSSSAMKGRIVYLHRFILGMVYGRLVDHANGNTMDNRRRNLRICTSSQNVMNSSIRKDNSTGFKGVGRKSRLKTKPFYAKIKVDKRDVWLGYFATAEEAHKAYCEAAEKYFGEFARFK